MRLEARLRAVEKAVDARESARYDWTWEQVLMAVRAIRNGASSAEAWASVGPPRVPLRADEPTLGELIVATRVRRHQPTRKTCEDPAE